ncbi:integral membrane protein [Fusarium flagelliforme]|uniref:GDP-mannose transporter n=1 Tax=Fusarium flagelliforme TaxID=2675880 RepID=A0A395MW00_9HYPO|nr:integral membrane protein [Fusarium flagelliforme]
MFSNVSSGDDPTLQSKFNPQNLSHYDRGSPYSDEENNLFLSEHHEQDGKGHQVTESSQNLEKASFWIAINIVATVLIVFTNKAIFDDDNLKFIQLSFAAFHFSTTWLVLWVISRQYFALFMPKHVSLTQMLPLSIVMTLNIIFPNLSLAFSTVTFYQVARVLVTPCVAILDYVLYKVSVSGMAASTLVVACFGVAMVSYYDSRPSDDASIKTTSQIGIIFALMGVFFSSLYTVWIAAFRKRLAVSSMQLLLNQAPLSAFLLLYSIPWVDEFPAINEVSISHWVLIPFSGVLAMLINISQFFIIAETGPIASTVSSFRSSFVPVTRSTNQDNFGINTLFAMIFTKFIAGVVALSVGVSAGPCRVGSQSSGSAAATTTTAETSLATSTILTTSEVELTPDLTTFLTLTGTTTADVTSAAEDTTTAVVEEPTPAETTPADTTALEATTTAEATTSADVVIITPTLIVPEATTSAAVAVQCHTNEECDTLLDVSGLNCSENYCECGTDFMCHVNVY